MNCTHCLYNTRVALRRVFLTSTSVETASTSQLHQPFLPSLCRNPTAASAAAAASSQRRLFGEFRRTTTRENVGPRRPPPSGRRVNASDEDSGYDSVLAERQNNNFRGGTEENINPNPRSHARGVPPPPLPANGRLPRDEEIQAEYVLLRNEDGRLSSPQPIRSVLFDCSMRDQTLVTLALPQPGSGGSKYPICLTVDRASYEEAERDKAAFEKEKAKEARKVAKMTKELEINWATAPHDLDIKMKRLREFLQKGLRVEVRLVSKSSKRKGKREATREEAQELLRTTKRVALEEVVGTKEWKPSEGTVGKSLKMFLEGPQKRAGKARQEEDPAAPDAADAAPAVEA